MGDKERGGGEGEEGRGRIVMGRKGGGEERRGKGRGGEEGGGGWFSSA